MIRVIQTNQSLNVFGQEIDFQSFVKEYNNIPSYSGYSAWEIFKDSIKYGKLPKGINKKPIEVTIDDDFHLEVLYRENENMFSRSQFYLVHNVLDEHENKF